MGGIMAVIVRKSKVKVKEKIQDGEEHVKCGEVGEVTIVMVGPRFRVRFEDGSLYDFERDQLRVVG